MKLTYFKFPDLIKLPRLVLALSNVIFAQSKCFLLCLHFTVHMTGKGVSCFSGVMGINY